MVQVFSLVLLTESQAEALLDRPQAGLFILLTRKPTVTTDPTSRQTRLAPKEQSSHEELLNLS